MSILDNFKLRVQHFRTEIEERTPPPSLMKEGEIALNLEDRMIYSKNKRGDIVELTINPKRFHTVSFTGDYNDLENLPYIPEEFVLKPANDAILGGVIFGEGIVYDSDGRFSPELLSINGKIGHVVLTANDIDGISVVGKTGSYHDLFDKPYIPEDYILPTATRAVLGGIKIGEGVTMDESDKLHADVLSVKGKYGPIKKEKVELERSDLGLDILDGNDKVMMEHLPPALVGHLEFKGTWDAKNNVPRIPPAALGNKGHYYYVSHTGTTPLDGVTDWDRNDIVISDGTKWVQIKGGISGVMAINGKTGVVRLVAQDIPGLHPVAMDGDYNSLVNKPYIPDDYVLPIASSTVLGGVKVGKGLTIQGMGTLNADVESVNGRTGVVRLTIDDFDDVAKVGKTGKYSDLLEIPETFKPRLHTHTTDEIIDLAKVASTGSYYDLKNRPKDPNIKTLSMSVSGTPVVFPVRYVFVDDVRMNPHFNESLGFIELITGNAATIKVRKTKITSPNIYSEVGEIIYNDGKVIFRTYTTDYVEFLKGEIMVLEWATTNIKNASLSFKVLYNFNDYKGNGEDGEDNGTGEEEDDGSRVP